MNIVTFPLGELQTNCYLLIEDKSCLIIDPADEASFLLEEILRRNLKLTAMLATHGHFDHVLAVGEIQLSFRVPLYMGTEDLFLLKRLVSTTDHFLKYKTAAIAPTIIKPLGEGLMSLGDFNFQAIKTPGHTPGSYSFLFKGDNALFTGDTLFKEGIGAYDHSYSSKTDLFASLQRLSKMVGEAEVYPGHGESTTLASEKSLWGQ